MSTLLSLVQIIDVDWSSPEILSKIDVINCSELDGDNNTLPLHHVLANRAPASLCLAILNAYPEGAAVNSISGYPLHISTDEKFEVEAQRALLEAFPLAAQEKDGAGRLPLHLACANQSSLEVVSLLLQAYPQGAKESDRNGYGSLPLRIVMGKQPSKEVTDLLIQANPQAVQELDAGSLPLHEAVKTEASVEVVEVRSSVVCVCLSWAFPTSPSRRPFRTHSLQLY